VWHGRTAGYLWTQVGDHAVRGRKCFTQITTWCLPTGATLLA
jgi:hypothetical protein